MLTSYFSIALARGPIFLPTFPPQKHNLVRSSPLCQQLNPATTLSNTHPPSNKSLFAELFPDPPISHSFAHTYDFLCHHTRAERMLGNTHTHAQKHTRRVGARIYGSSCSKHEGLDLLRKRDQGRSSVFLVEGGVNLSRGASWNELGLLSRLDLFLSFFLFLLKILLSPRR